MLAGEEDLDPAAPRESGADRGAGTSRRSFRVGLALIAAAGLAWRVVYANALRDDPVLGDGVHYDQASRLLAEGRGFLNPLVLSFTGVESQDAKHPPLWTIVLWAGNHVGLDSTFSHQLVAVAVGVATVVMVGLAGRAAFGPRAGLIAAGLAAIYPNLWLFERELMSETPALLLTATLIWAVYTFRARPRVGLALALGALAALLALTRSELILVTVLVVAPVILAARQIAWRTRVGWLAMAAATCIAVIMPWFLFNLTRFEEPVPLSAGLGGAMQAGNCDATYEGDLLGYYQWGCIIFVPTSPESSVSDREYRTVALDYISAHKGRFVVVAAARLGRTFGVYRPFQQVELEHEFERGTDTRVLTAGLLMYWVLAPLAIAGAVIARRRGQAIYPLVAFFVIVVLAVVPTIGAVRYRAPAEIALVLLAAVAIDAGLRAWSARSRRSGATTAPVGDEVIDLAGGEDGPERRIEPSTARPG